MQRINTNTALLWMVLSVATVLFTGCLPKLSGYEQVGTPGSPGRRYTDLQAVETVKSTLYDQLGTWRGVRYRSGGMSKSGLDCSGFVYLTFQSRFGITLPRDTRHQAKSGKRISSRRLRPGDLVFFKTGWRDRHVGIYIEERQFVHVSTKKGVMLSSLDDPYWQKRYWKAVRISR